MEQVGLKAPTVCENSLASEVGNQMTGNISVTNFPKSATCRAKNGLLNGITEDKCNSSMNNSKSTLITIQEMGKSAAEISKEKHKQNCSQNYIANRELSSQFNETTLNHGSDESDNNQSDFNCSDSLSNKNVAHCKQSIKLNCADECIQVNQNFQKYHIHSNTITNALDETSLSVNDFSSTTSPNTTLSLNCTTEVTISEEELAVDFHDLKLKNNDSSEPIEQCIGVVTTSTAVDNLNATTEIQDSHEITYVQYESELQMPLIMKIIQKDLSEPYSIYTYRYFIHNWPKLCFLAMCDNICVGAIVCKLDYHRKSTKRGYIAMLAVDQHYRKRKIGSTLVRRAIKEMIAGNADEVVLETEVTNKPALRLYELLGFVRDKRLFRYYLNGVDALRLKLWLR